jgi:hypothetical protein
VDGSFLWFFRFTSHVFLFLVDPFCRLPVSHFAVCRCRPVIGAAYGIATVGAILFPQGLIRIGLAPKCPNVAVVLGLGKSRS